MNTNNCKNLKRIPGRILLAVMAAAWLSWALPAGAGKKTVFTIREWTQPQFETYSDDAFSFPGGNMHIHSISGISLHLADNPLLTGIGFWTGNLQWDAEGNGVLNGTWRLVVGDVNGVEKDAGNYILNWDGVGLPPGFAPSGDVWEGNFHAAFAGGIETSYVTGRGVAGTVDGLMVQARAEQEQTQRPFVYTDVITDPKAKK